MKKHLLFVLAATALAACSTDTTQDLAPEIPTAPDELQVSFDEEDTRIQLGDAGRPVWTKGDLVSVFYRSNANSKYQFTGETGDVDGTIKLVEEGVATQQTTQIVAVYPYSEDYWFNWNTGDVEAFLPAEQIYLKDSFGIGSSLMVSSNVFTQLSFKNVCGWLKLQFTGTGYVSKIVLKGNNGEQVAGKIYVNTSDASSTLASTMGESGEDIIESRVGGFIEEEGAILTEITLNCGDGVALNSETPTAFYIALPPQTFEKGFTATMYGCDGSTKEISTENSITIERNHILPMASATLEMPITNNVIWYTSSDGNVVEPNETDVFGANITSNTYENGVGIITFDGDVTTIGGFAFAYCGALTSVTIPDSVTTIGGYAFYNCSSLTSVTIPNSVTVIGEGAFWDCSALTSVTIPDSVTSIGYEAFYNCDALTSVTIGNSVTTIGGSAFKSCSALTSVTIGDGVTTIGEDAFAYCDALKSVTIPNSVTTIGSRAFVSCDALKAFYGKFASADNRCLIVDGVLNSFAPAGLTTYSLPDSVTTIGSSAFYYCRALTSVTIPDSVTTIGYEAFYNCDALKEVYCKPTTPPNLGAYSVFGKNASDRKIYVPTASVDAYKAADGWKEYADAIVAMPIPSNEIWYTSSDGNVVEPYSGKYNSNATAMQLFGANITSNTYENGVGVITFDGDVTKIGYGAFYNRDTPTSVTIPNSVTVIGKGAFLDCDALTSITIPDGVTVIEEDVFYSCDALKTVYCKPTTPPSLDGVYVFDFNASDRKIYVPTASVDAYKAADGWKEYADAIEPYNFAE